MTKQTTNYQCPSCTGPLHYDGSSGKLQCDYCGSAFSVREIEELYAAKHREAEASAAQAEYAPESDAESGEYAQAGTAWGEEAQRLCAYSCTSCGAELICEETTAATSCPYCGNPSILPGKLSGMLRPDYVIPFKLDKEAAVAALKKYYRGKKFLPGAFAASNHIQEIKGVYVPFWLYSGRAEADIRYAATRVHSHVRGDERITTTEHYMVRRAGSVDYELLPVDASTKMPDAHMDAIEPFDYSELRPFSMAYLPGYLADKYDVSVKEAAKRADRRAANTAEQSVSSTVIGYTTCVPVSKDVRLRRGQVKYALLPVWMLSTQWKGKNFLFAMNGQTGKLIGDLPVSAGKFAAWFAGIGLPLMALFALLFL